LPAGFCIVTAPTAVFNLLDLVLPMLVRLSPVVCMLVPRTYVVDGLAPRQQWLQSLEALGRLHLVAGASARSHAHEPHLWLVIFWDNSTRLQMLAQELHQTSASFQFVV
jgi:hypothetical protein